jgi:hypothetical protein
MATKFKIVLAFLFVSSYSGSLHGQNLSMEVLASSGNEFFGKDFSIGWTIGENFVETFQFTEGIQTLGFHQTYTINRQTEPDVLKNSIWIYPNPVVNTLHIHSKENVGDINLQVIAVTGQLVLERKISMLNSYEVQLSGLNEGTYILRLINDRVQNYTFIKMK